MRTLAFFLLLTLWSCNRTPETENPMTAADNAQTAEQPSETTTPANPTPNSDATVSTLQQPTAKNKVEAVKLAPRPSLRKANPQKTPAQQFPIIQTSPFTVDYLMGKFNPSEHPDFAKVATTHTSKPDTYLRKDAYQQFVKMFDAAQADGIKLTIISATRPFGHQKSIWEAKWTGKRAVDGKMLASDMPKGEKALKILRWSSMPGTSRHHWGTDFDLNSLENSYFATGQGKKTYDWLLANAGNYGFCQVYSPKGNRRPNGYEEEKWHWSYTPVAQTLTQRYKENIKNEDIAGFEGADSAVDIQIIENYVLGLNPDCF